MLVSKTNKIPDKEITVVLGPISVKVFESEKWARERFAINLLEREVIAKGGNAIINFSVRRVGLEMKDTYSGIAVVARTSNLSRKCIVGSTGSQTNDIFYIVCIAGRKNGIIFKKNVCWNNIFIRIVRNCSSYYIGNSLL